MDLDLARIEAAASLIDPVFRDTPQFVDERLSHALRRRVTVKLETANPIRSFKGRGADFALRDVEAGREVVCASSGNYGQAVAYCGRSRGVPVRVFVAPDINPDKRARMEALGAKVIAAGSDGVSARAAADEYARTHPEARCLHDGREAAVAEGAGTVGVELTRLDAVEAVVLPVGDGALITGVGRWLKATWPDTRLIGVNAAGAPSMAASLRAGHPVPVSDMDTFADGIAIAELFPQAVGRAAELVDEMVLVDDADLTDAMALAARSLGVLPEPAAVAGLAAIARGLIPYDNVATVITGANPRPEQLRSLAAALAE